ncbi:MAG: ABC transporter permease [Firmicutes bacterium]|jgi:ABC-2 type transport system permease protein|nr:ABC transporter permease [Bacillota bacterium]
MRFLSLAGRNIKEIYRDPAAVIMGVIMPAVLLLLFASMGQGAAPVDIFTVDGLTPAVTVFSFGFLTLFSAMLLARDRESAFLTRLLIAPLKATDFILAYMLPFLPVAALQIVVCLTAGSLMGMKAGFSWAPFLVVMFILAVACIGIGMILGSLFSVNMAPPAGSLVVVIIGLFGGVWMPLKQVGGIFGAVGYALPFAHAVDAARAIVKGAGMGDITVELYWLLGYTVLFFLLGVFFFRWKTKQ